MTDRSPPAPKHLRPATRAWWTHVVRAYQLEPHHLRQLEVACASWDEFTRAREALEEHGLTFVDRLGSPRQRPEVAIARDAKTLFLRALRELALDTVPPPDAPRPPAAPGTAGVR